MHHALEIQEIVELVYSHLDPTQDATSRFQGQRSYRTRQPKCCDLAAMAQTCSSLGNPALDLLWKSASLVNILRCMPSDLWAVNAASLFQGPGNKMRFLRPIQEADWDRVLMYAPRIRNLFSTHRYCSLSDIFPMISKSLPGNIFPNLTGVHWWHHGDDFAYINLFISPSTTSISFHSASPQAQSLLETLPGKCPVLKDVYIASKGEVGHYDFGAEARAISSFVQKMEQTESLSVRILDQPTLEHLSGLETVKSLALETLPPTLSFLRTHGRPTFPQLRAVDLGHSLINPAIRFLDLCTDVPLESFNVCFPLIATAGETHDLLQAISAACLPAHLRTLTIQSDFQAPHPTRPPSDYLVPGDSLRFLAGFTNLRNLFLKTPIGFDLDDAAVEQLARSWPRLITLHLEGYIPSSSAQPRTTLASLRSIAHHCPLLTHLAITLDATSVPVPAINRTQRPLESLDVDRSAISAPEAVARFVFALFPELRVVLVGRMLAMRRWANRTKGLRTGAGKRWRVCFWCTVVQVHILSQSTGSDDSRKATCRYDVRWPNFFHLISP
ncbi:hypothetical protein C8R43DRAFT_1238319 [Mycena crocata]|nr:hypothetical protein C8R43DRAFT_1238319 [Mycena crocata]